MGLLFFFVCRVGVFVCCGVVACRDHHVFFSALRAEQSCHAEFISAFGHPELVSGSIVTDAEINSA